MCKKSEKSSSYRKKISSSGVRNQDRTRKKADIVLKRWGLTFSRKWRSITIKPRVHTMRIKLQVNFSVFPSIESWMSSPWWCSCAGAVVAMHFMSTSNDWFARAKEGNITEEPRRIQENSLTPKVRKETWHSERTCETESDWQQGGTQ